MTTLLLLAQAEPAVTFFSWEGLGTLLRVLALIIIGLPLLQLFARFLARLVKTKVTAQHAMLLQKGIFYTGGVIIILTILRELNFDLTALLGAAGIVGVAIGFASQTSLSNLISGLFLISEKPFQVGDLIRVGTTSGMVLSIDLLSIKLRTFDNLFIRMPNEQIIKSEVINVTRFPIRRLEIKMGVAYKEDISRTVEILKDVADKNPHALDEPEPLIAFTGFGESQLDIFVGVWHLREEFLLLRNSLLPQIKERLDAEGIEIPFPHRTLYVGEATGPMPINLNHAELLRDTDTGPETEPSSS